MSTISQRNSSSEFLVFSASWFYAVTLESAGSIAFPSVAHRNDLKACEWSDVERPPSSIPVTIGDIVPSARDTVSVMDAMSKQFKRGRRSVSMTFQTASTDAHTYEYHFAKFPLFLAINHHRNHILSALPLINYLENNIHFATELWDRFKREPLLANVQGFHSVFPLWRLSCLEGEAHIWDDVLSAGCEITYTRMAAELKVDFPPFLILSTSFYTALEHFYRLNDTRICQNLQQIRDRIISSVCLGFGFIVSESSHYSAYFFRKETMILSMYDSLNLPANPLVAAALRWFFAPTSLVIPSNITVHDGPTQGTGSGSCGIAALNYIQLNIDPSAPCWTGDSDSLEFRSRLLADILKVHFIHKDFKENFQVVTYDAPSEAGPFDLPEFNLSPVTHWHPVYYTNASNDTPLRNIVLQSASQDAINLTGEMKNEVITQIAKPVQDFGKSNPATIDLTQDSSDGSTSQASSPSSDDLKPTAFTFKRQCVPPTPTRIKKEPIYDGDVIEISDDDDPRTREVIDISDDDEASPPQSPTAGSALSPLHPVLNTVFESFEDARDTVYKAEASLGFKWKIAQSKPSADGGPKRKIFLRCNHYYHYIHSHSERIDPSDHRQGRTVKTDCCARVNLNRVAGATRYCLTHANWVHNHARYIPEGGNVNRPATAEEKALIQEYGTSRLYARHQVNDILRRRIPDHTLEPRQISNIMNNARRAAAAEVQKLGGDLATVVQRLKDLNESGSGYYWDLRTDEDGVMTGIFWQSPEQVALGRRYGDILLNDNAFNRNQYQFPLDLGLVIDNTGKSRNVFYSIHQHESTEAHEWVLGNYIRSVGRCPENFFSDRHRSLPPAVRSKMARVFHLFCLHHLSGNVSDNLRLPLGNQWEEFLKDFWALYRAVSPEHFDQLYVRLTSRFPGSKEYLDAELYPIRTRWAWAWISNVFTAGVRTTGRVENENREGKRHLSSKTTMVDLFDYLNSRTVEQAQRELVAVRQSSRRQLNHPNEGMFARPLHLLRTHVGPFALHQSWTQMSLAAYYVVRDFELPPTLTWQTYAEVLSKEPNRGFEWINGEEAQLVNDFSNDAAYISAAWLLELILGRGLQIQRLYYVTYRNSPNSHALVTLADGRYLCNCGMGTNLGIPCRHFYATLLNYNEVHFRIEYIRRRWYQDPDLDTSAIPPITLRHAIHELVGIPRNIPLESISNHLDRQFNAIMAPPLTNRTLGAREVYSQTNNELRQLLVGVETDEQVQALVTDLRGLRQQREKPTSDAPQPIRDPPIPRHNGRPRTARLTSAREGGRPRGGGGRRGLQKGPVQVRLPTPANSRASPTRTVTPPSPQPKEPQPVSDSGKGASDPGSETSEQPRKRRRKLRCGQCGRTGHNRRGCYDAAAARQDEARAQRRRK